MFATYITNNVFICTVEKVLTGELVVAKMTQNVVKISALTLFDKLLLVKMSSFTDIH